LAAIAAFLALVLLIVSVLLLGIHAPCRHAMPRTQKSGQARLPGHVLSMEGLPVASR
jgi:hypothetical protein